jgi:hypothetical protein
MEIRDWRQGLSENVETDKSKFNWVAERSACTIPKIFRTLRLQVEEDVKTRNALRPELSPYEFSMVESGDEFQVVLEAKDVRKSVTFAIDEHAIIIRDDNGNQLFEVTVSFTEEGKCRINAREQKCELWQVQRMALEDLMFRAN